MCNFSLNSCCHKYGGPRTGQSYQECCFIAGGGLEDNLNNRQSVALLCMQFKIKSNIMHSLRCVLPLPYVPALLVVLWLFVDTRLRLLAVELLIAAKSLCPSQCLFGTII